MKTVLVLSLWLTAVGLFAWAFFWTQGKVFRWQQRMQDKNSAKRNTEPKDSK